MSEEKLPDAYERLLLDAMLGDSTLFSRNDALEASWKFIDPIEEEWKKHPSKDLCYYKAGSTGPTIISNFREQTFRYIRNECELPIQNEIQ